MYVDRAFMNESLLTLLSIAALRSAQLYLRDKTGRPLLSLLLTTSLIAAINLCTSLSGGRSRAFARAGWSPCGAPGRTLGSAVSLNFWRHGGWFRHAHSLFLTTGLTFGFSDKLFDAELTPVTHIHPQDLDSSGARRAGAPGHRVPVVGLGSMRRRRKLAEVAGVVFVRGVPGRRDGRELPPQLLSAADRSSRRRSHRHRHC